jgi:hypothetical protein
LNPKGYATKGRAGGKLPGGNFAVESPDRSFSEAVSEGSYKPGVGFVELAADALAKRVEAGSGRFLRMDGLAVRLLRQNRLPAEGLSFLALPLGLSLGFDSGNQRGDALAILVVGQSAPAGQGIQGESLDGGIPQGVEILSPHPGGVFFRAIEPESLQVLAGEQGIDRVGSGPVLRAFDEALLDAVREDVLEALDLGLFLVADDDRLIPPSPDGASVVLTDGPRTCKLSKRWDCRGIAPRIQPCVSMHTGSPARVVAGWAGESLI